MAANTDINMKDHDILIATYTLQQELIRRFDDYIKSNEARHTQTEKELSEAGRHRTRIDGEISSLKGAISNSDEKLSNRIVAMEDRIEKAEVSSRWLNVAAVVGSIIAGTISILVWVIGK